MWKASLEEKYVICIKTVVNKPGKKQNLPVLFLEFVGIASVCREYFRLNHSIFSLSVKSGEISVEDGLFLGDVPQLIYLLLIYVSQYLQINILYSQI